MRYCLILYLGLLIMKEIKVFPLSLQALTQFLRSCHSQKHLRSKNSQTCAKLYYPFVVFLKDKLHQCSGSNRIYPGILKEKNRLYFSEVFRQYGSQCHSKQAYSLDSLQHSHPTLLHTAAWIEKVVRDRNSRKLVSAELVYSV